MRGFVGIFRFEGLLWHLLDLSGPLGRPDAVRGRVHAATISRTIRYQRGQILRHAASQKRAVRAEAAFLENAPDRGTVEVADEIAATVRKRPELTPILIDFSDPSGWRRHHELRERMVSAGAEFLPAEPAFVDGRQFDPVEHFRSWAERWSDHAGSKEEHRETILAALKDVPERGA